MKLMTFLTNNNKFKKKKKSLFKIKNKSNNNKKLLFKIKMFLNNRKKIFKNKQATKEMKILKSVYNFV